MKAATFSNVLSDFLNNFIFGRQYIHYTEPFMY